MKRSGRGKKISLHPDDLYKSPRTRNSGVTCLAFGENRKARYPGYFFCHGCDLFEDAIRNGNKRAKRTQSKYACTAGNEAVDSGHPTTLHQPYRPARNNSRVVLLVGGDKQDEVATNRSISREIHCIDDIIRAKCQLAVTAPWAI